ncbi:hypothetical protein IAR50_006587 [Cryptococcus sp. DSM 104548]
MSRQETAPWTQGGTSLRENPEAGPSRLPVRGDFRTMGRIGESDGDGVGGGMEVVGEEEGGKGKGKSKSRLFGAKAVAAMTGAMATSLLMTPFDVLKTRLQTVPPHPTQPPPPPISPECCQTTLSNPASTCATSPAPSAPGTKPQGQLSFSALRPSSAPVAPPSGCLNPSKWAGIWGETVVLENVARSGSGVLVLPRQVDAQHLRGAGAAFGEQSKKMFGGSFFKEVRAVRAEAGVRGLWKGVGTAMMMGIPSSAIYMLGYEQLSTLISPYFLPASTPLYASTSASASATETEGFIYEDDQLQIVTPPRSTSSAGITTLSASLTPVPLIAGSLARTLSATVISPIEMFRTRLQALPTPNKPPPSYASVSSDLLSLTRSKGLSVLYRGLGPTLWRDVPFSGLYWAGFEGLKTFLTRKREGGRSSWADKMALGPTGVSFTSGFMSGTLAALLTQPFDVLKTRRQVFNPLPSCPPSFSSPLPPLPSILHHSKSSVPTPTPTSSNSTSSTSGSLGTSQKRVRVSTLALCRHVIKEEGWQAVFRGTSARCGKVAPACGLMIACYEGVGRILGGEE